MSHDNDTKRPSHIAYQVREGEDQKAYFNRIGAAWTHKDGEGFTLQLDSLPVDGRVTIRSVQERIQEMKDAAKGGERREPNRSQNREERRDRSAAPRYER
ncbi:hypothetical protein K9U40_13810 [Xanthobacter autotrophicus]|uniref:hypothetical protein n=1 Tax=Xanthobacter TaxID=279 RepID=UPI0024AA6149|nr:hypothetical protein [Xanthobacter autotrophicus]MDI4665396.1 hypothetical protein [Xanthobacter autotrophicus]